MSRLNRYMQTGPCGLTVDQAMGNMSQANAAFSTFAWESAKQEGCIQCPGARMPQWPPRFIYPQFQKTDTEVLGGCPAAMSDTQSSYVQQAQTVLEAYPYSYDGASQYKPGSGMTFGSAAAGYDYSAGNPMPMANKSPAQAKLEAEWLLNSSLKPQKAMRP